VVDSEESAQLQVPPVTASPTADAIEPPAAPSVAQDSAVVSEAVVEAADTAEAPSTLVEQASAVADDGSAAVTRETQTEDSDATVKRVAEEAAQDFKADDRDVLANEVPADSAGPTSDEVGAAEEEQQQAVEPSPELPVSVTSFVLSQSVPQAENSRLKQADATEAAQAEESVAPADLPVVAKAKQDRGPRRRGPLWSGLAALLVIGVTGWLGRDLWYPAPVPEMVAAKSTQKVPATDAERAGVETRASNAGAEIQTSAAKLALKEPESTEAQPLGATEGQAPSSVETQAAAETDGEQAPTVSVAAIETEEATLSEQSDPAVEEASENEQPATLQEPPSLTAAERLAKLKQDYARRKNEQPAGQDADVQQSTDDAEPLVTAKLDASPLAAYPVSVKAAAVSEATKEHPAPTDAAAMENETDSHQTSGNVTDQQTGSAFDQKSAGQQTVTDSSGGEDSQREENQMQAVRRAAAMAAWESVRSEIEWVESSTPESKTAKSASKKKHTGKAEKSAAAGAPLSPASAAKEIEKLRKLEQAQRRLEQQLAAQRAERDRLKEEAEHERARAEEARKLIQEARERARLSWDQLQKTPEAYPEE
jgi:hypothetical protein